VSQGGQFRDLAGRDAYEILGVSRTASKQEISRARRERQRDAHPDRGLSSDDVSKLINRAADILLDDQRRRDYDQWRAGPPPADPEPSLWDDAEPGFTAPAQAPRRTPGSLPPQAPPGSPYRGTGDPPAPGPVPGPGPGNAPMYGSPQVMPHLGQPPPQYYHQPAARKSNAGLIVLVAGGLVLLVCFGMCLLSLLPTR
jgi:hypothetical protein